MNSFENVGKSDLRSSVKSNDIRRHGSDMGKTSWVVFSRLFKELMQGYKELYAELKVLIKKNAYKVARSIIIGVVAFAVCVGLAFGVLYVMGTYNKYIFTTDNWKTYKNDRINMIENMESKIDIVGMNQKEVEKLLGKPRYVTEKEKCEYLILSDKDFDNVVEYELNSKSKSITDVIKKYYVIAYKNDKAIYADVLIADTKKRE